MKHRTSSGFLRRAVPSTRTVLLVEDDEGFAEPVSAVLTERGYHVLTAHTGARAMMIAEREKVDLVVVDGLLPDVDGVSWISAFRQRQPGTPVAFVSAFSGFVEALHRAAGPLGIAMVIRKGIEVTELCDKLEACLTSGPTAGDPAANGAADLRETATKTALRSEFARSLPGRLRQLAIAIQNARSHTGDLSRLREVRTVAHKLRGSAACQGFARVGECAGRIDDVLAEPVQGSDATDATWACIDAAMHEAGAAVEEALDKLVGRRRLPLGVGGARLLVLSNDALFRASVEEVGHTHLIEVAHTSSPTQAVACALATPPDAVLVDLGPSTAPVSLAAVERLRALSMPASLPIAFVASGAIPELRLAAAEHGAELFMTKPIGAESLGLAVRQLLAPRHNPSPRIVVVSSGAPWAQALCVALAESGFVVTPSLEPRTVLTTLEEQRPDLLLVEQELEGLSGVDVCRIVRTSAEWQDLPIVLSSARQDERGRIAAFEAGADDHVVRPVSNQELFARMRVRLERLRVSRDRYEKDLLTGLAVRRTFLELCSRAIAVGRRHDRPVTVCLLDLDFFKSINDRYGHRAGDRVLAGLGRLFTARFRAEDVCGRWGGEEFALAFPGETARVMGSIMEGVLDEFASMRFYDDRRQPFGATFSAGLASAPDDGMSLEALLEVADRRLYAAKHDGRACVVSSG